MNIKLKYGRNAFNRSYWEAETERFDPTKEKIPTGLFRGIKKVMNPLVQEEIEEMKKRKDKIKEDKAKIKAEKERLKAEKRAEKKAKK